MYPYTAHTLVPRLLPALEKEAVVAKGLTFHGLRHRVATELHELGFDSRLMADMLGQRSESMALHDSQGADLQEKLRPAVEKMEDADKTRTDVSGKSGKTVRSPEAPFGASVSSL